MCFHPIKISWHGVMDFETRLSEVWFRERKITCRQVTFVFEDQLWFRRFLRDLCGSHLLPHSRSVDPKAVALVFVCTTTK
jgi:hypothetical protein